MVQPRVRETVCVVAGASHSARPWRRAEMGHGDSLTGRAYNQATPRPAL